MNVKIARIINRVLVVIACIALVFGITASNKAATSRGHDTDDVSIKIVGLEQKYNEHESPYTNGCYHVTIEYEITNNSSAGINYIQFDAIIKNKGNEDLAQITSDFGDSMSVLIDAGQSKKFKADISDNQPVENNNIQFMNLYDAKASKIHADCDIKIVMWEDGVQFTNDGPSKQANIIDATGGDVVEQDVEEDEYEDAIKDQDYSDCILPYSSSEYLTEEEVEALPYDALQYAINEIYARHGRKFVDKDVRDYFNSMPWYSGTKDDVSMNELNEFEQANIELLTEERNERDSE